MTIECVESDGTQMRSVRLCKLTPEKLKYLHEKLSQFEVMFNEHVQGDMESFIKTFLTFEGFDIQPTGLIWEVDDVGILYLTEIRPAYEAQAHFSFWDRKFFGRENLIRKMMRYVFDEFGFHRIVVEVPLYAKPTLFAIERIGFVQEGRKREAVKYRGKWFDMNLYSILEHEV